MSTKKSAPKPLPVRDRKPITAYPDPDLRDKIAAAAAVEDRSLGNMLCEIARQWFAAKQPTEG